MTDQQKDEADAIERDKAQTGGAQRVVTGGQRGEHQRFADQPDDLHCQDARKSDAIARRMKDGGNERHSPHQKQHAEPAHGHLARRAGQLVSGNVISGANQVGNGCAHVGSQDSNQCGARDVISQVGGQRSEVRGRRSVGACLQFRLRDPQSKIRNQVVRHASFQESLLDQVYQPGGIIQVELGHVHVEWLVGGEGDQFLAGTQ